MVDKGNKGKVPMTNGGPDKDGFTPIKTRAKERGQKQSYKNRQSDEGFKRFDCLDNLALEEGIPIEVSFGATTMRIDTVSEQVITNKDKPMMHV